LCYSSINKETAMESCDKIKDARHHLRQAAHAFEDRVLGKDVAQHLRHAARSALQAGIAALDERAQHAAQAQKNESTHAAP
jgi:hypothetical protein